jgi:hypothetical protein
MLNKSPYLFEPINELDTLLERMDTDPMHEWSAAADPVLTGPGTG